MAWARRSIVGRPGATRLEANVRPEPPSRLPRRFGPDLADYTVRAMKRGGFELNRLISRQRGEDMIKIYAFCDEVSSRGQ